MALEAVKGQKTVNEVASEFGVDVSQIDEWKRQQLAGLPQEFNHKGKRWSMKPTQGVSKCR